MNAATERSRARHARRPGAVTGDRRAHRRGGGAARAWIRFLIGGGEADADHNQLPAFATRNNRNRESSVLADVKRTGFIKN